MNLKAVSFEATALNGIARNVIILVGEWSGKTDFNAIYMDNYPFILGMEFLRQAKFVELPHLNMVCVMDEGNGCCVPIMGK